MNHLYREASASNQLEGASILGDYLIAYHHSTLLLFDHDLNLLRKQYFYEKILGIRKITNSHIAILFNNNKFVQCDIWFNPYILRVVAGDHFDVYNDICVIHNEDTMQFFNVNEEEIHKLKFSKLRIYSPTRALLVNDYVSKLMLHSYSEGRSLLSIVNLDGNPSKVDEFDSLDDPLCFDVGQNLIVVLNRNFLQIRFRRESFIIPLNQNLDATVLRENQRQNVIEPVYDENKESKNIFMENPHMFVRDDTIYIINGNGEFFRLSLKIEPKKILGISISFIGKISRPSGICFDCDILCVTSLHDDTVVYYFDNGMFKEKSRLKNIGLISAFSSVGGRELVLASGKGAYNASFSPEIQIHKKKKIDFRVTGLAWTGSHPVVLAEDKAFKVGENLELDEIEYEYPKFQHSEGDFHFSIDINGLLSVFQNDELIKSFSGVTAWGFTCTMLALARNGRVELYNVSSKTFEFSSSNICEFDHSIFNEEIITGPDIHEISHPPVKIVQQSSGEKICEMMVCKDVFYYILIRTTKQLYIYRYTNQMLIKVLINRPISFQSDQQHLFDLKSCVYCRTKHSCIIVFRNDVYVYDVTIGLGYPIFIDGWIFAISKGHVVKCKISGMKEAVFTESMILKPMYAITDNLNSKPVEEMYPVFKNNTEIPNIEETPVGKTQTVHTEDYRTAGSIKHIISLEDCNILCVSKQVPFFYRPFIPMVHITEGPGGKPHSEPINKEELMNINTNPLLTGRTLRYEIQLKSTDFKPISACLMEENEFICDIKLMFDNFLVVCTSYPEGEDKMTRGKLTVYSLVNIVPDPMNPHITKKLKLICSETFKDPCTCCVEVRSLIAVCIGTKLMIYEFNENTGLAAVGRNEISLLCTSIFSTKNLIAVADIMNGIHFFFLRPRDPLKLHLLSHSCRINNCRFLSGIDFCTSSDDLLQLSLVSVNKTGNIQTFTYSPNDPASKNGNQLVSRAYIVTNLSNPLYECAFGQINSFECVFFSLNVMARVTTINFPKVQAIQHCIAVFVTDRCGINVRNYTETDDFVNPECKNAICEKILLEFYYFKPTVQNRICELVGLEYSKVVGIIETCLHFNMIKKI